MLFNSTGNEVWYDLFNESIGNKIGSENSGRSWMMLTYSQTLRNRETEKRIGTQVANWTKHWEVEKQHIHTWSVYGDLRIQKPQSPLKEWQSLYLDVVMWISDASNLRFGRACCAICCLLHVWWHRACMNIGPVLIRQRHPVERYKKTRLSSV